MRAIKITLNDRWPHFQLIENMAQGVKFLFFPIFLSILLFFLFFSNFLLFFLFFSHFTYNKQIFVRDLNILSLFKYVILSIASHIQRF